MKKRCAFTLVELTVSLAVATLLAVNAVPPVMQAREASRRTVCKNQLKQYGLAMHNYHETFNSLPPGFVVRNWDSPTQQGFGWNAMLLPYMDYARLYNEIPLNGGGLDEGARNPDRKKLMMTPIGSFHCPSDPMPTLNAYRGGWPTSSYSANAGALPFPRLATGTFTDYWPGRLPATKILSSRRGAAPVDRKLQRTNGLFAVNSSIKFAQIPDGTSNTLLMAERGPSSLSAIWWGVTAASHENDALTECSHLSRPNKSPTSFSSMHEGGLHILLSDGSVRFIKNEIESKATLNLEEGGVWQKLASREDGKVIEPF